METPVPGSSGKRGRVRAIALAAVGLALLAAVVYFVTTRQSAAQMPAEQAKLMDVALGSDDEAERRAASRRLAELNRGPLDQIKRLRVVISTYSSPDVPVSLSLPETAKKLLTASGLVLADSARGPADAIMHIRACCLPEGASYSGGGYRYSGARVGGALLLETQGRLVYASAVLYRTGAPLAIRGGGYSRPSDAPFDEALGWGLLSPLGPLLNAKAVPPLMELRRTHSDWPYRDTAMRAFSELRDRRTVERLASALREGDSDMREMAVEALGRLKEPRALEPLLAALKDVASNVRSVAARALGELNDRRAAEALLLALRDGNEYVRWDAAVALCRLRDPRGFEPALAVLRDQRAYNRSDAAEALAELRDPRAVEPLLAAFQDTTSLARGATARALGRLKDPRALDPLITAMGDSHVSDEVAEALGEFKDPRVVKRLIPILKDGERGARQCAAKALGVLGDPLAVEPLIAALKDTYYVRREAAEALGLLRDTRAVKPLVSALNDEEHLVREAAATALGRLGDLRALEPLIAALGDKGDPIFGGYDEPTCARYSAAKALGDLNDPRAIEPLRALLKRECSPATVTALVRLELHSRLSRGR